MVRRQEPVLLQKAPVDVTPDVHASEVSKFVESEPSGAKQKLDDKKSKFDGEKKRHQRNKKQSTSNQHQAELKDSTVSKSKKKSTESDKASDGLETGSKCKPISDQFNLFVVFSRGEPIKQSQRECKFLKALFW